MEQIPTDQFAALNPTDPMSAAIAIVALVVCVVISVYSLKLSISWFGEATPGFFACMGWMIGICLANFAAVIVGAMLMGQAGLMLVVPFTWFVTLYMVTCAANCGFFRAFGILFVHSIVSTFATVAVLLVMTIPLAAMQSVLDNTDDNLNAEFDQVDEMMAEFETQIEAIESAEATQATNVGFQPPQEPSTSDPSTDRTVEDKLNAVEPKTREDSEVRETSTEVVKPKIKKPQPRRTFGTRRAADGTTVNPFFQN